MVLLGDVGQVESRSVRLEMVLVSVADRCTVCAIGSETILDAPIVLLGDKAQVQARFGLFRDSTSLIQDRCTVCAKRSIGSYIVLDALDGTPT